MFVLLSFLQSGVTLAYLRSDGNRLSTTDVLNKLVSGVVNTVTESLMICEGISSNSTDFFGFNFKISVLICISFTLLKVNVSVSLTFSFSLRILGCFF